MKADEKHDAEAVDETAQELLDLLRSRLPHRISVTGPVTLEASDLSQIADRMLAAIPTTWHPFASLGPYYDTAGLQRWLDITRQAISDRSRSGRLLACPTSRGKLVYPAWQFTPTGSLVPGLADVLRVLLGATDPWTAAIWLTTPSDDLAGLKAIDALANPSPTTAAAVLRMARRDATRWAA